MHPHVHVGCALGDTPGVLLPKKPSVPMVSRWCGSSDFRNSAEHSTQSCRMLPEKSPSQRGSLHSSQPRMVGSSLVQPAQ